MSLTRILWWLGLLIFLAHQYFQYVLGIVSPLIDSYLDAFLCMPLLLGLWNWERARWWKLPALKPLDIGLITCLAYAIFEYGYPYWSTAFVGDYRDGLAYCAGSLVFWGLNHAANEQQQDA
jgi:hypothetical protein